LQGSLLQVDISQIIVDEADEPNSLVDFVDAEPLSGQDGRDVDFLSVDADTAAGGDEDVAGGKCYPCVRYDLSPMSRVAHTSKILQSSDFRSPSTIKHPVSKRAKGLCVGTIIARVGPLERGETSKSTGVAGPRRRSTKGDRLDATNALYDDLHEPEVRLWPKIKTAVECPYRVPPFRISKFITSRARSAPTCQCTAHTAASIGRD
jgi:hypothetical protein